MHDVFKVQDIGQTYADQSHMTATLPLTSFRMI